MKRFVCRLFGHWWRYELLSEGWIGLDEYLPVYGDRLDAPCRRCGAEES